MSEDSAPQYWTVGRSFIRGFDRQQRWFDAATVQTTIGFVAGAVLAVLGASVLPVWAIAVGLVALGVVSAWATHRSNPCRSWLRRAGGPIPTFGITAGGLERLNKGLRGGDPDAQQLSADLAAALTMENALTLHGLEPTEADIRRANEIIATVRAEH